MPNALGLSRDWRRRGRKGGRPPALGREKVEQIIAALEGGRQQGQRVPHLPSATLDPNRHPGTGRLDGGDIAGGRDRDKGKKAVVAEVA
jgi:hypothetical protein